MQIPEGRDDSKSDVEEIQSLSKDLIQEWKKMAIKSKPIAFVPPEESKKSLPSLHLKKELSITSTTTCASDSDYYFPE